MDILLDKSSKYLKQIKPLGEFNFMGFDIYLTSDNEIRIGKKGVGIMIDYNKDDEYLFRIDITSGYLREENKTKYSYRWNNPDVILYHGEHNLEDYGIDRNTLVTIFKEILKQNKLEDAKYKKERYEKTQKDINYAKEAMRNFFS